MPKLAAWWRMTTRWHHLPYKCDLLPPLFHRGECPLGANLGNLGWDRHERPVVGDLRNSWRSQYEHPLVANLGYERPLVTNF